MENLPQESANPPGSIFSSPGSYVLVKDASSNIFQLPTPFSEVTNTENSGQKTKRLIIKTIDPF